LRKKDLEYVMASAIICIGFSLLTYFLWTFLEWNSLFIVIPCIILAEFLLLRWIDKKHVIEERQKLIQYGLISASDFQVIPREAKDEGDRLKNFIRLNLADLNELLLTIEEAYREAIALLDKGELEGVKGQFNSVKADVQKKVQMIESEVENYFKEVPSPNDEEQQILLKNYKDHYISEKQKKLERMEEIIKKFDIRSEFSLHLEDILAFEIEKKRAITDSDINSIGFPFQQANQLIKFLETPLKLKLEDLSTEEKQKYGTIGRKIIENCSRDNVIPNLPYLIVKFKMAIQEAKKILTYLQAVGIIETVHYHYVQKENQPR
jgi:hypothetical protein